MHKIDCIRTVIARSVSDEAISEMSLIMRLRRSLQSLAMTIGHIIRCKLFIALGNNIRREAFRGLSRGLQFGKVVDERSSPMIHLITTLKI